MSIDPKNNNHRVLSVFPEATLASSPQLNKHLNLLNRIFKGDKPGGSSNEMFGQTEDKNNSINPSQVKNPILSERTATAFSSESNPAKTKNGLKNLGPLLNEIQVTGRPIVPILAPVSVEQIIGVSSTQVTHEPQETRPTKRQIDRGNTNLDQAKKTKVKRPARLKSGEIINDGKGISCPPPPKYKRKNPHQELYFNSLLENQDSTQSLVNLSVTGRFYVGNNTEDQQSGLGQERSLIEFDEVMHHGRVPSPETEPVNLMQNMPFSFPDVSGQNEQADFDPLFTNPDEQADFDSLFTNPGEFNIHGLDEFPELFGFNPDLQDNLGTNLAAELPKKRKKAQRNQRIKKAKDGAVINGGRAFACRAPIKRASEKKV